MKNPHKLVREILAGLNPNQLRTISKASGIGIMTLKSWEHDRRTPRIDLLEAFGNAAGYNLVWEPRELITMNKSARTAPNGAPRLMQQNGRMEVFKGNHMIGYVADDLLFGIDGKGFASEIGFVGHRVEIIPKLTAWRATQGIIS